MRLIIALIWLWLASPALADGILMNTTGTAGAGGGGGGGGAAAPAVTWDTTVTDGFTYTNGNLTATCSGTCTSAQKATRSTKGYAQSSTAKVYYEINTVTSPQVRAVIKLGA